MHTQTEGRSSHAHAKCPCSVEIQCHDSVVQCVGLGGRQSLALLMQGLDPSQFTNSCYFHTIYKWTRTVSIQFTNELSWFPYYLQMNSWYFHTIYKWTLGISIQFTNELLVFPYNLQMNSVSIQFTNELLVFPYNLQMNSWYFHTIYRWTLSISIQSAINSWYFHTIYKWTLSISVQFTNELLVFPYSLQMNSWHFYTVCKWILGISIQFTNELLVFPYNLQMNSWYFHTVCKWILGISIQFASELLVFPYNLQVNSWYFHTVCKWTPCQRSPLFLRQVLENCSPFHAFLTVKGFCISCSITSLSCKWHHDNNLKLLTFEGLGG